MFITLRGAKVYYEQHGAGAQNVLLLHGWGCTSALWKPVTQSLARRARVTVIDFPGHGQSSRPPEPWGTEDFAAMCAELIEALDLSPVDIVAHSHGGRVALLLAATRPEIIRKMALTGAAGLRKEPTPEQKKREAAFNRVRHLVPGFVADMLRKRYGSADYRALDAEMRKTFVRVVKTDLTDLLPQIKAPTLLLWGDLDTETPLWMGQKMEKLIPDVGLVLLSGGTHFAYLEKTQDFLRITEHFLFGGNV